MNQQKFTYNVKKLYRMYALKVKNIIITIFIVYLVKKQVRYLLLCKLNILQYCFKRTLSYDGLILATNTTHYELQVVLNGRRKQIVHVHRSRDLAVLKKFTGKN